MGLAAPKLKMLEIEDRSVPLRVKRHGAARRITLRLDPEGEGLHLVLPRNASLAEGLAFAESHRAWISARLAALPPRVPFGPGQTIPLQDRDHLLSHCPGARRGVWREAGAICVSGDARFFERRVGDFLRREARAAILPRVQAKAATIERRYGRVTLRDPKTRWGSCTASGDLSFSWRLILAPEPVLDYVVAHEVAHLAEHNHSRRFWRLTGQLTAQMGWARRWLTSHGNTLLRYGPASSDWSDGSAAEGTQT